MTQSQKYLRTYIRLQAILLCLILGAFGACLAAQRTRVLADGAPAAVRQEHALPQAVETLYRHLPDMPGRTEIAPYLAALPAPYGCLAALFYAVWETGRARTTLPFININK